MKIIRNIIFLFLVFSCDSENANDCFQKAGSIIQQDFVVGSFDKILVNRDIELVVKDGLQQRVIVETGSNLLNDVSVEVIDGQLILKDNNNCNFVRDYGVTKVFVTSPNIKEIRSSTQYDIRSDGVLSFNSLTILSEDFGTPDTFTNANFFFEIDCDSFNVTFNNLSNCFISGKTENLNVGFFAGTSRFEGEDLIAQNVTISHRSSNDIIVNPQQYLKGVVRGTGDLISVYTPPIIEVEELYTGRLIFK